MNTQCERHSSDFFLIVVLFILLIIVGNVYVGGRFTDYC